MDLAGNSIRDLGQFLVDWNQSFSFDFVAPEALTPKERLVFELARPALALLHGEAKPVKEVLVSNTMRPSTTGQGEVLGLCDPTVGRIIIKRDQLRSRERFLGTLLHEVGHALTAAPDVDARFEDGLTHLLGKTATAAVAGTVGVLSEIEASGA